MLIYRIYTEDLNREKIEQNVSDFFDGFTVYSAIGFWKTKKEKSLIIEILGKESDKRNVFWLADLIKESNKQESVLVTTEIIAADFV